jgi:hypothetical protein
VIYDGSISRAEPPSFSSYHPLSSPLAISSSTQPPVLWESAVLPDTAANSGVATATTAATIAVGAVTTASTTTGITEITHLDIQLTDLGTDHSL